MKLARRRNAFTFSDRSIDDRLIALLRTSIVRSYVALSTGNGVPSLPPCAKAKRAGIAAIGDCAVHQLGGERQCPERLGSHAFHSEERLEVAGRALVGFHENLLEIRGGDVQLGQERVPRRHGQHRQLLQRAQRDVGRGGGKRSGRPAHCFIFVGHQIQRVASRVATHRFVRDRRRSSPRARIASGIAGPCCGVAHSLLHDAPVAGAREEEHVVIQLIAVLHGRAVDLGRRAARIHERPGLPSDPLATVFDLSRRLARGIPFAPGRKNPGSASISLMPSLTAPHTVVVTPLECQSNPRTQPNAWNQNGSERRRSTSRAPNSLVR